MSGATNNGDTPNASADGLMGRLSKSDRALHVAEKLTLAVSIPHGVRVVGFRVVPEDDVAELHKNIDAASDALEAATEALEKIAALADDDPPSPEEIPSRLLWIEAELEEEPTRSPYGRDDEPPCRNGYEVTELIAERAGLLASLALTKIAKGAGQ